MAVGSSAETWVLAEMITHSHIWRGAGHSEADARTALLAAWTLHRHAVVAQHPQLAPTLPEAADLPTHFPIRFMAYACGGGYRDGERVV
ncbi:MAG: hypothetical protein RJA98_2166 [Pseudomonadota bacterium]|jgi:hypothetical protein